MQSAVAPLTQHRNLWCRIRITVVTVTSILEMMHVYCIVRFRGCQVVTDTTLQLQLTATTILNLQLYCTQWTIVLANLVQLTCPIAAPTAAILGTRRTCICVWTVDETAITPVTPRVYDNPGTYLVLVHLTGNTVTVQVKLDTVIPTDHCQGMVDTRSPGMDIVHVHHACSSIVRRTGNPLPVTAAGYTKANQTATVEILVSCMVVQPCLCSQATFLGTQMIRDVRRLLHTVEETLVPFVIALHPTKVRVLGICITSVDAARSDTAIGLGTWHTHILHKRILAAVTIGQQPNKVRRIAVVQVRRISITERVHLVSEHIADSACGTARAAALVEYCWEMLEISIIPMIRKLTGSSPAHSLCTVTVSCHLLVLEQAWLRFPRLLRVNIVRIGITIYRHPVSLTRFIVTLSTDAKCRQECHQ